MSVINPITQYKSAIGLYPANNKQWWVARADADDDEKGIKQGDFLPDILDKFYSGNNRAPQGHYVLNAFHKDRSSASGVAGLPLEVTKERPTTVCFFSGRAWYACNSTVYFSQLMTGKQKAGLCYQEADPTAEDISDLIATDGGVIPIPEANKIIRLLATGSGVMVFAINGVWFISGTDSGFSALDYTVDKVSPIGTISPMSVVETEDAVYWWSNSGIMATTPKTGMFGPIAGKFEKVNITQDTIQQFYNEIPDDVKKQVKGIYDPKSNTISWLYRDEEVEENQYNRVLNFETSLTAFYPWKFSRLSGDETQTPVVKGFYLSDRTSRVGNPEDVVVGGEDVLAGGDQVVDEVFTTDITPTSIEYLTWGSGNFARIALVTSTDFVDWKTHDGIGVSYESYVESGYELFDDAMRNKNITYIFSYLRQTEEGWTTDGDGNPVLINPSSCYLRIKYDWANSLTSNKWTYPVQVYRGGQFLGMPEAVFDTGFPIVVTKSKVRGNGRALQFRYGTNEPGKNFDLHGWSIAVTGNTVV